MNITQIDAIISVTGKINALKKLLNTPSSPDELMRKTLIEGLEKALNVLLSEEDRMPDHYIKMVSHINSVSKYIENEILNVNKSEIFIMMQGLIDDLHVICYPEKNKKSTTCTEH